jgi:UDP:flavonoid glycosyltransferase YjiC (YdhE family)
MRVTFVTWDGGGNEPPAIALADALRAVGHSITFAGYETQRERLERRGFAFRSLARASAEFFEQPWPRPMPALVMVSAAQAADVRDMLHPDAPDLIVVDCLMFGALAAMEAAGTVPGVVLVHSAPCLLLPDGGVIDGFLGGMVGELRTRLGLAPVKALRETWVGAAVVATTIEEMDPSPSPLVTYIGPTHPTGTPQWTAPWDASDERPLIVASFSTGGGWDQRSRVERTLTALEGMPVRALMATGDVDPDGLAAPANVHLRPFVPHDEVLPSARVLITHAGHGSVMAALRHGVPMVCLPNEFSDQPAVARRVADLGAAIDLQGDTATPTDIGDAVALILRTDSFAIAADGLRVRVGASPGTAGFLEVVNRVRPGSVA